MDVNFNTTHTDITPELKQVALSYVTAHYDVPNMSLEDFLQKYRETYKELSNIWHK